MRKLTQEQRIKAENAELIAKFEGYEVITENGHRVIIYSDDNERTAIDTYYESSWDWLMPCVLKIGTIEDPRYSMAGNFDVKITNTYVWVDPPIGDRIYFSGNSLEDRERPLIEKVYEGVVAFIKFYNNLNRR